MPPPRPPSRTDLITFPAFASTWHGSPSLPPSNTGGVSVVAYSGGGGSAKTGVFNLINVSTAFQAEEGGEAAGVVKNEFQIDTGEQIGVGVAVHRPRTATSINDDALLAAAVGDEIRIYSIPLNPDAIPDEAGEKDNAMALLRGSVVVGDKFGCNAVSWSPMGNAVAVGCENGRVRVYMVLPSGGGNSSSGGSNSLELRLVSDCEGHEKAVCSVHYHPRGGAVLSSAKDGTARIWDVRGDGGVGTEMAQLKCQIESTAKPAAAPPGSGRNRRQPQILVRGCAFGDLEGKTVYTVASGRKGSAYLSKWRVSPEKRPMPTPGKPPLSAAKARASKPKLKIVEELRMECYPFPVSAVSISGDASHLALGGVDGTVTYFNVETMKPAKKWFEIHDLPVTCIAARPTHLPLPGEEEEGINVDVISASADNRLSKLTLQRRSRKRNRDGGGGGFGFGMGFGLLSLLFSLSFFFFVCLGIILAILTQLSWEACEVEISSKDFMATKDCIWNTVLWAPSDRPGVSMPPH